MDLSAARPNRRDRFSGVLMLTQCLVDEAQIPPAVVESAIDAIAKVDTEEILYAPITRLMTSKYKRVVKDTVWKSFIEASSGWTALGGAWQAIGFAERGWRLDTHPDSNQISRLEELLRSDNDQERSLGLLTVSWFAFRYSRWEQNPSATNLFLANSQPTLEAAIKATTLWESFLGLWALAWLAEAGLIKEVKDDIVAKSIQIWLGSEEGEVALYSGKALSVLPVLDRSNILSLLPENLDHSKLNKSGNELYSRPNIIVSFYVGTRSDEEIVDLALSKFSSEGASGRTLKSLLGRLGNAGQKGLSILRSSNLEVS